MPRKLYEKLMVEIQRSIDSLALHREALERGISIAPGRVFSNGNLYDNFVRINCSHAWSAPIEEAVKTLGRLAGHAMVAADRPAPAAQPASRAAR